MTTYTSATEHLHVLSLNSMPLWFSDRDDVRDELLAFLRNPDPFGQLFCLELRGRAAFHGPQRGSQLLAYADGPGVLGFSIGGISRELRHAPESVVTESLVAA